MTGFFDLNERGQEESVFKLLIAGVFATAILMILVDLVGKFSNVTATYTQQSLVEGLVSVSQSISNQVVKRPRLNFEEGTLILSAGLAEKAALPPDKVCLKCTPGLFTEGGSVACPTSCLTNRKATVDAVICREQADPKRYFVYLDVPGPYCV